MADRDDGSRRLEHTIDNVENGTKKQTYQQWLDHYLHCQLANSVILVLVVLDSLIIYMLLLIDIGIIHALCTCSLAEDNHSSTINGSSTAGFTNKVLPVPNSQVNLAGEILHYISLCILCLFMLEVILKLVARSGAFFKYKLEVLDAVLVTLVFVIYVVYSFDIIPSTAKDGVGLLIVFRLWRIREVIRGAALELRKEAIEKFSRERKARIEAECKAVEAISQQEWDQREISSLKEKLSQYEDRLQPSTQAPEIKSALKSKSSSTKKTEQGGGRFKKKPTSQPVFTDFHDDHDQHTDDHRISFDDKRRLSESKKPKKYQPAITSTAFGYDNESYDGSLDAKEEEKDVDIPLKSFTEEEVAVLHQLQVLKGVSGFEESYDGAVTYTTEDGVPMTSL